MTKRLAVLATAFTFGLSAIAQAAPVSSTSNPSAKGGSYRAAKYNGGEGATWQTGRDAHAFAGSYGGCRYSGHAGPNGYKIDRVC